MKQKFLDKATVSTLILGLVLILILLLIPTGFEDAINYKDDFRAVGVVTATDNSTILTSGLIQYGEQTCVVRIKDGEFAGQEIEAVNFLSGSLASDKIYVIGDEAFVRISARPIDQVGDKTGTVINGYVISSCVMTDHYRLDKEFLLLGAFFLLLVIVAGRNGIQAIFSFVITILAIWKLLIPACLRGYSPVWLGIGLTSVLTVIIIYFVYGFDRRTLTACLGSMLGILTTCILGILFTDLFKIHGAVMPDSESLLYSGFQHLDLTAIFMSSIFIGASGAMMDLSVDITSAVHEVVEKKPDIGWKEAAISGMNVGKAAMGTMTTTLLLAYSGGYITSLMVYMAQGTPIDHILNYKYVASEILDTVIGSFGLVTVAPFTALMAGLLLTKRSGNKTEN